MKKITKAIAVLSALCFSVAPLASCMTTEDGDQTLEIVISKYGYGVEWLNDQIELFKQQAWVQKKYPNLNIPEIKTNNSSKSYCVDQIAAGPKTNTADLLFTTQTAGLKVNTTYKGVSVFEDLSTGYYESTVPGENIKVKDKMIPEIYADYDIEHDGVVSYYGTPWVNGFMGLLYNVTLVNENLGADYVMPRTTDELVQFAADLKAKDLTPFIFATSANYWVQMFQTWWAQYDGVASTYDNVQGYNDFWNGQIDGEYTREIFNNNSDTAVYRGRYKSLKVIESLIGYGSGNYHGSCANFKYLTAQKSFLDGEGVMMPNGDWFDVEMKEAGDAYKSTKNYDITFMKTPVISSIIEQCNSIGNDDELATIVQYVDENKSYDEASAAFNTAYGKTLSSADYARINEARRVMYRLEGHEAYVPSYAAGKELAIDFLRFMATDISIEQFMKSTGGCVTSFNYDAKSSEAWDSFSLKQKAHVTYFESGVQMPAFTSFKLHYYGSLAPLTQTPQLDLAFVNDSASARKSPEKIINDDYSKFNSSEFEALLIKSGIK
ncbi:MAG: hypothetical protein IJ308_06185 [Clostridia bacterium]|nr:hypothetical protein [Clostridia bacterium]